MINDKRISYFLKVFGDTPKVRILDFLIENYDLDYPITAIAKESKVSYNSLKKFFAEMLNNGFVIKTRKIGKSDYYKLNISHPLAKELVKLDWSITEQKILLKEKVIA